MVSCMYAFVNLNKRREQINLKWTWTRYLLDMFPGFEKHILVYFILKIKSSIARAYLGISWGGSVM